MMQQDKTKGNTLDSIKIALQYILPKHFLSRLVGKLCEQQVKRQACEFASATAFSGRQ